MFLSCEKLQPLCLVSFPWKPRMKLGLWELHHKDTHPQIPSACPEPHPEERNAIDGVVSSNWKNGYTIWTFHWRWCCSTKILQSVLWLETIVQRVHGGFTAGCWRSWGVMRDADVLYVTAKVKGLHYRFPECTGEIGVGAQRPKISVITMQLVLDLGRGGRGSTPLSLTHRSRTTTLHRWAKQWERTRVWQLSFTLDWWMLRSANVSTECGATKVLDQSHALLFLIFSKTHIFVSVWKFF